MPYKKGGRLIGGFPSQRQKRRPPIATKKPKRHGITIVTKKDKPQGANVSGQSAYAIPDNSNEK